MGGGTLFHAIQGFFNQTAAKPGRKWNLGCCHCSERLGAVEYQELSATFAVLPVNSLMLMLRCAGGR